ncbi:MAG: hypothetical protein KJ699_18045 [Alphaproteobacteria bacterium]|nr:hypothetical protein [Alphaproteobacteria bacterium]
MGLSDPFREIGLHGGELLPAAADAAVEAQSLLIVSRAHKPSLEWESLAPKK